MLPCICYCVLPLAIWLPHINTKYCSPYFDNYFTAQHNHALDCDLTAGSKKAMEEQQMQTIESSEATPIASESSSWRKKRTQKARMEAMRWVSEPSTASPNLPGQSSVVSPSSTRESSAPPPNLLESSSAAPPICLTSHLACPHNPPAHMLPLTQYPATSDGDIEDHRFPPRPPEDKSSCSEV